MIAFRPRITGQTGLERLAREVESVRSIVGSVCEKLEGLEDRVAAKVVATLGDRLRQPPPVEPKAVPVIDAILAALGARLGEEARIDDIDPAFLEGVFARDRDESE